MLTMLEEEGLDHVVIPDLYDHEPINGEDWYNVGTFRAVHSLQNIVKLN